MDTPENQLISEIKKYVKFLDSQIHIEKIILFGSYGKGNATTESDIDVAIISPQLGKAPLIEKMKLFEWRYDANILIDIQPVPIGLHEYELSSSFFIQEIKDTGIDITRDVC
jgi:predicted nucleotidyltransferase